MTNPDKTPEELNLELAAEKVLSGSYKRDMEKARAHQETLASVIADAAREVRKLTPDNINARQMNAHAYKAHAQHELTRIATDLERHIYTSKAAASQALQSINAIEQTRSHL